MIEHFLLTVTDLRSKICVNAYLMCDDRKYINRVLNQMSDEVEKLNPLAAIFAMQTKLSPANPKLEGPAGWDGIGIVRKIVCKNMPEAEQVIKEAKNFHCSMWAWDENHEDYDELMALH